MQLRKYLSVLCVMGMVHEPVLAVTQGDIDEAIAEITADSTLISQWMVDQFRYIVPFNSTTGNVVPHQFKLFGFELGINASGSNTEIDIDNLRAMDTTVIDTNEIDMPSRFPFPAVIAHAKIGLPYGFDAGIRLGGIPEKDIKKDDTTIQVENKIFGLDVRKALIEEGITRPFGLTMGLSYTHAAGELTATSPYQSNLGTTIVGSANYTTDLDAVGTDAMEWDVDSVGAQLLLHKKILFFTPYVGTSATYNSGDLKNSLATVGTVTLTEQGNPGNTQSSAVSTIGTANRKPNPWDIRALLGAEFTLLPFMRLGIYGEYAGNKNAAGSLGLRFQFR